MTRVEYGRILHMNANAQQAAAVRAEKDARRRFQEQQREKMRRRAAELRQRQTANHQEMVAIKRAAEKKAPTTVITLSNMTSHERALVAKALWSPVLCGENDKFETPQQYYGC